MMNFAWNSFNSSYYGPGMQTMHAPELFFLRKSKIVSCLGTE